jgi:ketosteroid isomerase-like protein
MLCGGALMAYGIVTSAVTLIQGAGQGLRKASATTAPTGGTTASTIASASAATPPRASSTNAVVKAAAPKKVVTTTVEAKQDGAKNNAEAQAHREIIRLYEQWKAAWRAHNINAIMSLYSRDLRFHSTSFQFNNAELKGYNGRRFSFLRIWDFGPATVDDKDPPNVDIQGQRAILIVGQHYRRTGGNGMGRLVTSRYTLEKQEFTSKTIAQSRIGVQSSALPQKNPAPTSSRQWRIVGEERLEYQGSSDVDSQIY